VSQAPRHGPDPAWKDWPTQRVDIAGATLVHRRLGAQTGVPLVMLNHWGAVLGNFDPRIVDGLAAARPVIALNYRGVGGSRGQAPLSISEMAKDVIEGPSLASRPRAGGRRRNASATA
jgi:pimeloyl-ACP methyl ester carboxylesterase